MVITMENKFLESKEVLPMVQRIDDHKEFLLIHGPFLSGIIQFLTEKLNWEALLISIAPIPSY